MEVRLRWKRGLGFEWCGEHWRSFGGGVLVGNGGWANGNGGGGSEDCGLRRAFQ